MKTVEQILDQHNVEVKRNVMECPAPGHDDNRPSCRVNEDYVYCFSCGWNADAAGLEAVLSQRPIEEVLREWSSGKAAWQTQSKTTSPRVNKHKHRLSMYSGWNKRSQSKMNHVLRNLPSWYHEAAKEQLWDIFDAVMKVWKDAAPYDLEQEIAFADSEVDRWMDYWKGITE